MEGDERDEPALDGESNAKMKLTRHAKIQWGYIMDYLRKSEQPPLVHREDTKLKLKEYLIPGS